MKKQVSYICDICGAAYDTEAECAACESKHVKLETATMLYMRGGVMPTAILIKGDNGIVTRYDWYQSEEADDAPIADNEYAGTPIPLSPVANTILAKTETGTDDDTPDDANQTKEQLNILSKASRRPLIPAPKVINLHEILIEKGLTRKTLSAMTGIPERRISKYATGVNGVPEVALNKLCTALKCTPKDLIVWRGAPPKKQAPQKPSPVMAVWLVGLQHMLTVRGFSRKTLAQKINYSRLAVDRWANCTSRARPDRLPKIAAALDCTVPDLLTAPKEG